MRVAVIGAAGDIGRSAVPSLVRAGHEVVPLARSTDDARRLTVLGTKTRPTSLLDHDGLVAIFDGVDVVCNLATAEPRGVSALRPHAWRSHDRLRTDGVRRVLDAAREAGVRRVVQESVSFLYAGQGDAWIGEGSPVEITRATEPASVGESYVQDYACGSRTGVVLRFATVVGADPRTRWWLRSALRGRAAGLGSTDEWAHLVHTDDVGPAVLAALGVPSGVYNVGAEPVRRADLLAGFASVTGRERLELLGPVQRRLVGVRLEPHTRSLRVSSAHFTASSGWRPDRAHFDPSWLVEPQPSEALR
ncbi:MAG: NAD(P)-dependent oxidoreductase [Nocardioidaceae bacterium]